LALKLAASRLGFSEHLLDDELANLHFASKQDGCWPQVHHFESDRPRETGMDRWRGEVHEEAKAGQGALSFYSGGQAPFRANVIWQIDGQR
jgi:hypothetical protein